MIRVVSTTSTPRDASTVRLVEAICDVIATGGLDRATVRGVAAQAAVAIGTVQYHFPTKDVMLEAAFRHVVTTTQARVAAIDLGPDFADNLYRILCELLPLDDQRLREARVYLAFASRATTDPQLAAVQRDTQDQILTQLSEAFENRALTRTVRPDVVPARVEATLVLAMADGLLFDAVTRGTPIDADELRALLQCYLTRTLGSG